MEKYNHKEIEKKWQEFWFEKDKTFKVTEDVNKKKFYGLIEFPYASGDGLHTGHLRSNTAMDVICRKKRMQGYNVLYPIGFDNFGLPTENYAIKKNINPKIIDRKNIGVFTKQLKESGFSFDWSRSFATTDEDYYKWTQWIFIKMFEAGLAERKKETINWCTSCKIGLANEEVVNGVCERCGGEVVKREKDQWVLKITKYADRLISGLDQVDYLERIKTGQVNWIGKSEGATVEFKVPLSTQSLVKLGFKTQLNQTGYERRITWFITFPTKKRESVFKTSEQVLCIMNSIFNSCLKHDFNLHEMSVMDEHVHVIVDTDRDVPIEKIYKYLKGYSSKNFNEKFSACWSNSKGNHLWTPKGDYSIIENIEQYERIIKYVQCNLEKRGLSRQERLLSENLDQLYYELKVFTTRPDTLFGVTFMVVAPEHELVKLGFKTQLNQNKDEVMVYIEQAKNKSDIERGDATKEKTGVELQGIKAINPVNGEEVPIYVADYVMMGYGTGAIMAVPGHDVRDFEFAKKYNIPIKEVVCPLIKKEIKEDKPTEKRDVVSVIVKDLENNKILCLDWKETGWKAFPNGGTDGEDLIVAAKREVQEETGYKNIKFIRQIGEPFYQNFWRPHKGSNVFGKFTALFFELENHERDEVDEKEKRQHEAVWIDEDKVENFLNVSGPEFIWKRYLGKDEQCFIGEGVAINSGEFDGLTTQEFKEKITTWLEEKEIGKKQVQYKLRDWIFSRQRYWGEPIPMVYCEKCGWQTVPEKDLPIVLPDVEDFVPTEEGDSPLAKVEDWVKTTCPKCGGEARRETDVMPNWAGSNWYFIRYCDPKNNKMMIDPEKAKYWLPVDWYNGGMEHTTLHLLYSRFVYKFLYDIEAIPPECGDEPYAKRTAHGMILGEGGIKMSKSKGNVINPDDYVQRYGADTVRVYEMFMGPFDQAIGWDDKGVKGVRRFLDKVWALKSKYKEQLTNNKELDRLTHQTVKKIAEDIESMKFNTAISQMMILVNKMEKQDELSIANYELLVIILSPFAPHLCEELWEKLGHQGSINKQSWPEWSPELIQEDEFELVLQINGKVRDKIMVPADMSEEEAKDKALASEKIQERLEDKEIKKVVYVKGKLVNIVV